MSFSKHYNILKIIGEGSFSQVYQVEDKLTKRKFAEKRLKEIFQSEKEVGKCLEIRLLNSIDCHPNVVKVVQIICDPFPGVVHIIFELLDMSLYDFIKCRKSTISENKAKHFLYQLICGVDHLHKNNIIHRDIKPENILIQIPKASQYEKLTQNLISTSEIVKLADLGSGCYFAENDDNHEYTAYISTRWYRPPECLLTFGKYNSKIDIWALGCIFFELITLKPLFPGKNEIDQLDKINTIVGTPSKSLLAKFDKEHLDFPNRKPIGFGDIIPYLSNGAQQVLKHCLIYDPDLRISARKLKNHCYFIKLNKHFNAPTECDSRMSFASLRLADKSKNSKSLETRSLIQSKSTSCFQKTRATKNSVSTKQRERGWGMNASPAKDILLKKCFKT